MNTLVLLVPPLFLLDEKTIFFEKNSIDGRIVFKDLPISNLDIYFSDNR